MAPVQVHSKLAGAAADEFMASAGELAHVIEANRGRKLLKPESDAPGALRAPATLEQPLVGELALESRG